MTTEKNYPLAKDINGDPVDVPQEAVAWRVRRRSGKQGRPQSVFDPETGTPLEIELDSEIDELRPCGAGGYRLDAIDGSGKLLAGVTAYVEVPAEEMPAVVQETPSETAAVLRELTQLLRESMQTNCRALEAMASAFGPVRPVGAQPMPPVMAATPTPTEQKPTDWMSRVMEAMPMIMQALPTMIDMFKGAVAANIAEANAAGAPPPSTTPMA